VKVLREMKQLKTKHQFKDGDYARSIVVSILTSVTIRSNCQQRTGLAVTMLTIANPYYSYRQHNHTNPHHVRLLRVNGINLQLASILDCWTSWVPHEWLPTSAALQEFRSGKELQWSKVMSPGCSYVR
jgi:hypothetical protein